MSFPIYPKFVFEKEKEETRLNPNQTKQTN